MRLDVYGFSIISATSSLSPSHVTKIDKFYSSRSIQIFLSNQSEYRKSLTHFCCPSYLDWHGAICLLVRDHAKAANSVQQTSSVLRLKACVGLAIDQNFQTDYFFTFNILVALRCSYSSMVLLKRQNHRWKCSVAFTDYTFPLNYKYLSPADQYGNHKLYWRWTATNSWTTIMFARPNCWTTRPLDIYFSF